jgi:hypothetical protein
MNGGVLCEVAEVAIGVSHGGQRDPMRNGKPGYMSEDVVLECLTGHGRETSLTKAQNDHVLIAEDQDNWTMFPRLGLMGSRLERDAEHVDCCLGNCTRLEK